MQEIATKASRESEASGLSSEGLVLVNSFLKPIFVNHMAAEILIYPQRVEAKNSENFLASRIRSLFFPDDSTVVVPPIITTFRSGRRVYEGRAYCVSSLAKGDSQASVAILLQRKPKESAGLYQVSEKFNLTNREQQVVQYLSHGLTTKEIAAGMEISPNTVKNFVRMIMVKMGVSTRSGIVGKALGTGA